PHFSPVMKPFFKIVRKIHSDRELFHYLRRLPRPCRFRWKRTTVLLTNELGIHQSLSSEVGDGFQKSPFVIVFAFVKPERLLIQIPEQMKRLDAHIRTLDAALQQRPKVFQSVRVDMALSIALRMVNHLVNKLVIESRVRTK